MLARQKEVTLLHGYGENEVPAVRAIYDRPYKKVFCVIVLYHTDFGKSMFPVDREIIGAV